MANTKLDKVMAAINKKSGKVVVAKMIDMKEKLTAKFIPTPSLELNNALGGGWKRGAISETAGEHSSGKTSLWLETIALDQKMNPDSQWHWVETEGLFDWEYATKVHGIDPSRLYLTEVSDDGAESALDILEALLRTGELTGIVVNSVAGLTPKKEFEGQMADQNVGLQARMMSKLMRKIMGITAKTGTHVAFINQFREKVGVMHGDPRTTTGGRALAFFASQRLDVNKIKIESADGFTEDEAMKVGWRIRKNRAVFMRNPYVKGSYIAIYGEGIDQVGEIARLAPALGLCEKGGSWIYYPTKAGMTTIHGQEMKFQSSTLFMKFLEQHEDVKKMFFDAVMERMKEHNAVVVESMTEEEIDGVKKEEDAAREFLDKNGADTSEPEETTEAF